MCVEISCVQCNLAFVVVFKLIILYDFSFNEESGLMRVSFNIANVQFTHLVWPV